MSMERQEREQHFIFIPFTAQGHMIPMFDMARLFAKRGVIATIITTSLNAIRFKSVVDRAAESGLRIQLVELPFPCQEGGLPEGCENIDAITSPDSGKKFFPALELLQNPIEQFLQSFEPAPTCIISDSLLPWTLEIASKLRIPRVVFHGMCSFSLLCILNIMNQRPHEGIMSKTEQFVIPGLPNKIEISKEQLQNQWVDDESPFKEYNDRCKEVDLKSYGVVVNSCEELECEYVEYYRKAMGMKVWMIGPVSLCNKVMPDKLERGNKTAINEKQLLNWLDSKEPKSVVYACFGSLSRLTPSQLKETGFGLEASNAPFVWVIKNGGGAAEVEEWLSGGFEERVNEKGLIIRGWAPQTLILSHPAVGGFLTHCGWNSTLEAISMGVPLITFPQFGEQFLNERLIVNLLRIGVDVGVEGIIKWFDEENFVFGGMEGVKNAVERLMDGGEEGEERRKRAKELAEYVRRAMEEGGSSYRNMTLLIEDIKEHAC